MINRVSSNAYELTKWSLFFMLIAASLLPLFAGAQAIPTFTALSDIGTPTAAVAKIAKNIANIIGTVILAISVIMILFAAFTFLTAGGDADKVTSARTTLIYALVGVAVALLAFVIPGLVTPILTQ